MLTYLRPSGLSVSTIDTQKEEVIKRNKQYVVYIVSIPFMYSKNATEIVIQNFQIRWCTGIHHGYNEAQKG